MLFIETTLFELVFHRCTELQNHSFSTTGKKMWDKVQLVGECMWDSQSLGVSYVFSSETLFRKEALPITITVYMTSIVVYLNFRKVPTLKRPVHVSNEITVLCLVSDFATFPFLSDPYSPQRLWFTFIL